MIYKQSARLNTYCAVQNQNHAESWPQPGLWNRRQSHLPANLSCSDYTKCLACLWAILPFCSVKYKKCSGKGRELKSQAYQFTTFEFTEPGTGHLLYPGCEPNLGAGINNNKKGRGGGKKGVKEKKQI